MIYIITQFLYAETNSNLSL